MTRVKNIPQAYLWYVCWSFPVGSLRTEHTPSCLSEIYIYNTWKNAYIADSMFREIHTLYKCAWPLHADSKCQLTKPQVMTTKEPSKDRLKPIDCQHYASNVYYYYPTVYISKQYTVYCFESIYRVIIYFLLSHELLNYCTGNSFGYWLGLYHGLVFCFTVNYTEAPINMRNKDVNSMFTSGDSLYVRHGLATLNCQ